HQVKKLGHSFEAVRDIRRRNNDTRVVSLPCSHNLPEITLLGFGRPAWGGPWALNVDAEDGYLHHSRRSQSLSHQRKAAPRSGAHRPASCMGRADGDVDNSDLVLNLTYHDTQLAPMP